MLFLPSRADGSQKEINNSRACEQSDTVSQLRSLKYRLNGHKGPLSGYGWHGMHVQPTSSTHGNILPTVGAFQDHLWNHTATCYPQGIIANRHIPVQQRNSSYFDIPISAVSTDERSTSRILASVEATTAPQHCPSAEREHPPLQNTSAYL